MDSLRISRTWTDIDGLPGSLDLYLLFTALQSVPVHGFLSSLARGLAICRDHDPFGSITTSWDSACLRNRRGCGNGSLFIRSSIGRGIEIRPFCSIGRVNACFIPRCGQFAEWISRRPCRNAWPEYFDGWWRHAVRPPIDSLPIWSGIYVSRGIVVGTILDSSAIYDLCIRLDRPCRARPGACSPEGHAIFPAFVPRAIFRYDQ